VHPTWAHSPFLSILAFNKINKLRRVNGAPNPTHISNKILTSFTSGGLVWQYPGLTFLPPRLRTKESKIDPIFEYCVKSSLDHARRRLAPYVALTVLFLGGGLFLSRFAYFAFGFVLGANPAREPFSLNGTDQRGPIAKIVSTEPEAEKAGLKQGRFSARRQRTADQGVGSAG